LTLRSPKASLSAFNPGRRCGRIGLLGGSFNPAHEGHRQISLLALKHLRLDEIWWLVSPQNPLKPGTDMAPLAKRMAGARKIARHPRIRVSDAELRLGTRYTIDTLNALKQRFPGVQLVWLMGADNLVQLPDWARWTDICEAVPIAIFARAPYSFRALTGKAARRYAAFRVGPGAGPALGGRKPPAWVYFPTRLHPASATKIRTRKRGLAEAT
jgi:nicotinate-nucleotide adenylyltransferase